MRWPGAVWGFPRPQRVRRDRGLSDPEGEGKLARTGPQSGGVAAGAALAPPSELIYMLPAAPPVVAKATCPCPPWAASARAASDRIPQVNQGVGGTGWDS